VRTDAHDTSPADAARAETDGIGSSLRVVSGLTLASRVLGLARDVVLVRVFGDTAVGSAFAAALAVPNTFRRLFGEGALSAAFVPEYATLADRDPALATRFAALVLGALLAATSIIVLVAQALLWGVATFADLPPDGAFSLRLLAITMPFASLVCVAAILGGMLHVHKRFGPPAAAPILLNLCVIGAALPHFAFDTTRSQTATHVSLAVLVAGLAQVLWGLYALRRLVRWSTAGPSVAAPARRALRRFVPAVVGLGSIQLNTLIDTLIAMWPIWVGPTLLGFAYPLDERSNSILFFSQRLYQFPLGVFGVAVATVVFPLLSRRAHDPGAFGEALTRGIRLSLFISLPASIGLMLVSRDLIHILYTGGGGGLSPVGAQRATLVLVGYSAAVWAYSLNQLLTRAFYARGDTVTPMRVSVAMVGANVGLSLLLIWSLREAGLAWATALSAAAQTGILALLLRRAPGAPKVDRGLAAPLLRIGGATLAMAGFVLVVRWLLGPPATWVESLVSVVAQVTIGAGSYAVLSRILRLEELRWLLHRSPGA